MKIKLFITIAILAGCFLATCVTTEPLSEESLEKQYRDIIAAGGEVYFGNSSGNRMLPGSPYGYEIWSNGGGKNWILWYGPDERGGAAFRAEWNYPDDFLGRVGYYWNQGRPYTSYGNVFCDFEYTRSGNSTAGKYSYIGIYGWSRDPLIEYYIVEDWFGGGVVGPTVIGGNAKKMGEFEVDGSRYVLYQATRPAGSGNIEGSRVAFPQYFSVRQERRQSGTISITEHFKQWEKVGMKLGRNMYEAKFVVEAASEKGWLDLDNLTFYKKDD
jgi:endo-1,4-beta-xylanase